MKKPQDTPTPPLLNEKQLAQKALEMQLSGQMPSLEQLEAAFKEAARKVAKDFERSDPTT